MNYACVIVAAGKGVRTKLAYNKVLHELDGIPVIKRSLSCFIEDDDCRQIIIVINPADEDRFVDMFNDYPKIELVYGGNRRQDSVMNGLVAVSEDYVMIHDGSRPYLALKEVEKLKVALLDNDACLLAVASVDTVKLVENNYIVESLDRNKLYNAQTPQAFKTAVIIDSLKEVERLGLDITDDTEAIVKTGRGQVLIVEGAYSNIKITNPEDLS